MKEIPKEIVKEELKIAKKRLESAKLLFQNNLFEDSINRAYYSIFYAAKAMLNVLGFDVKTHSGLISEFGLKIVKEKLVPPKYGIILRRAYEMRESSDYAIGTVFGREEAEKLLEEASNFLKIAEKFVKERL